MEESEIRALIGEAVAHYNRYGRARFDSWALTYSARNGERDVLDFLQEEVGQRNTSAYQRLWSISSQLEEDLIQAYLSVD